MEVFAMPEFERNGERKWFRAASQGAHSLRTGEDPRKAESALAEAAEEVPPEQLFDDSPLLSRIRTIKPR
jgi:hypothetical protein